MKHFNTLAVNRLIPYMTAILGALDPDARIAGGYLRDTLLDKPVRDMDIFVSNITDDQLDLLEAILGVEFEEKDVPVGYEADANRGSVVTQVFSTVREDSDVQTGGFDLIVVTNVQTHLSEFPDNISRVSFGVEHGLQFGRGFEEGHAQEMLVYNDAAVAYDAGRIEKLIRKFPDYRTVLESKLELA